MTAMVVGALPENIPQSERIHNRGRETPYLSFALNHRSGEGMQAYDYKKNQPKCTRATPEDKQRVEVGLALLPGLALFCGWPSELGLCCAQGKNTHPRSPRTLLLPFSSSK